MDAWPEAGGNVLGPQICENLKFGGAVEEEVIEWRRGVIPQHRRNFLQFVENGNLSPGLDGVVLWPR